jgi:predicted phosphate transport protein (TIGR00153 family)
MRLIPRKVEFYTLLEQQAENTLKGARLLQKCFEEYDAEGGVYLAAKEIHDIEHTGDDLVHKTLDLLNRTFITPLDREDIYALTGRLDDVLDFVDSVAKRLVTFQIQKPTPHAIELSRIITRASEEIVKGVHLLRNLKDAEMLLRRCVRIKQLEEDADQVARDALTSLFKDHGQDPMEVIKWKDLYEHLELATDKAEDVANILETVLVKYT